MGTNLSSSLYMLGIDEAQQHFVLESSFMVKIFQVTISGWHGTSDYAVGEPVLCT
jgi:hypothetical protein